MPRQALTIGKRKIPIMYPVIFAIIILIILSFLIVRPDMAALRSDVRFASCDILAKDCVDITTCGLNIYCGDGALKNCKVYDCGKSYGVFAEDLAGNVIYKNEAKPDEGVSDAVRSACAGTMQILKQECREDKTETRIRLNTKGACEIESFAMIYENGGAMPNTFTLEEDGTYLVISKNCGNIQEIIPAAKGGIGLELQQAGA